MALLDFLKNKESAEKSKQNKTVKKTVNTSVAEKAGVVTVEKKPHITEASRSKSKFSYNIIREPHISEKASTLTELNQYTFKVTPGTNKSEIKKAVEGTYGVKVLSVNIIKIPNKKRRVGRTKGFKKGYTKAVLKLKQGDKIEIL
jgi:large subunit ribosomal protein L23